MTVYADVLVALNTLLTYIIIIGSRVLCGMPSNKWRVAIASFFGGLSSLVIFYDGASVAFSAIYKIITASVIILVAFVPHSIKVFFKGFFAFLGISLLFGGAVYCIEIMLKPHNVIYTNGTVYFDMSISYLVGCVLSVYGVFLIGDYLIKKQSARQGKCLLEITYNHKVTEVTAFIDTGNSLTDGVSARPVIVAELKAVSPLLTRDELLFFKNESYENMPKDLNKKIRLIPCNTVAGDGLLKGFVPDCVKIKNPQGSSPAPPCVVAVTARQLSAGDYTALVNNNIFING